MSADDWRRCPRCLADAKADFAAREVAPSIAYGTVSEEQYLKLAEEAKHGIDVGETLREDYEIATLEDGEFYVVYKARCMTCGWGHEFRHKKQLDIT